MEKKLIFIISRCLPVIVACFFSCFAIVASAANDVIVKLANNPHPFNKASNLASAQKQASREDQVKSKLTALNIQARYVYDGVLYGFSASVDNQQLAVLQADPEVVSITEVNQYSIGIKDPFGLGEVDNDFIEERLKDDPRDDYYPLIEFPQTVPRGPYDSGASASMYRGAGQHLYILDTGVDTKHKDLIERLSTSFAPIICDHPRGTEVCPTPYSDDHSHGTHVAGTALATDNTIDVLGIAPAATLHVAKVCNEAGSCPTDAMLAALEWAVKDMQSRGTEPAVANLSIGGVDLSDPGQCSAQGYKGTNVEAEAYCNATHQGLVIVVSAGNSNFDAAKFSPAKFDSTITVSSYDYRYIYSGVTTVDFSDFSNWGDGPNDWSTLNTGVITIAAPGRDVESLNRTHANIRFSGTSMSSPAVAGASALVLERFPQKQDYSAMSNVRKMLVNNAHHPSVVNDSGSPHKEGVLDVRFLDLPEITP